MESAAATRRQEALRLADELLRNIELSEITSTDIARKASRLARLLDDQGAMQWLNYEISGYPQPLDAVASRAAKRSNRQASGNTLWTASLGHMQSTVDGAMNQLAAPVDTPSGQFAIV